MSAVRVHDSQAYLDTEMIRERISLIFVLSRIFQSLQMVPSLDTAVIACTALESISGFDPISVPIAPR